MPIDITVGFIESDLRAADANAIRILEELCIDAIKIGGVIKVHFNEESGTTPARLASEQSFKDWMSGFRERNQL